MKSLRALLAAIGLLTRLPLGRSLAPAPEELGRALYFFPLVGALLGALLLGFERALRAQLSPELLAALLIAALAALTGGLHLDGVADVCDGLAGGRGDRARTLEIMRDSRIGALGAAALVLLLLAKVFAARDVLLAGSPWVLLAFPAVARAAVVAPIVLVPYARANGLGAAFHRHGRLAHVLGAGCAIVALAVTLGARIGVASLAALALTGLVALWLRRRLGGLTGDAYGCAIELAELAFLVVCAARG